MESSDKRKIAELIRKETGCGMMQITTCLDMLIDKLKHQPDPIMDVGHKLEMKWVEYDLRKNHNSN